MGYQMILLIKYNEIINACNKFRTSSFIWSVGKLCLSLRCSVLLVHARHRITPRYDVVHLVMLGNLQRNDTCMFMDMVLHVYELINGTICVRLIKLIFLSCNLPALPLLTLYTLSHNSSLRHSETPPPQRRRCLPTAAWLTNVHY